MLNVKQFRYGTDNLAYILYSDKNAMAVDGGACEEILWFCDSNGLTLLYVTNTHSHSDHTQGNKILLNRTCAEFLGFEDLADRKDILLGHAAVTVMRTPGHSLDSVCFYAGAALISGDTLFNGTIGNCFTGDLKGFYKSIKRLMELPPETVIYAGHDYVLDSLAFSEYLEPGNSDIAHYRRKYNPRHVCSSLAEELKVNPYLRFNTASIEKVLASRGLPHETEWGRWKSLMSVT